MKKVVFSIIFGISVAALAAAQEKGCCSTAKVEAKSACATSCASKSAEAKDSCGSCTSGCEGKAGKTVAADVWTEEAFMVEAHRMMLAAEGKTACCKSTAAKPIARGTEGCCNEPKQVAKFKVFVRGEGYRFFSCSTSAQQGRNQLAAQGKHVGRVQPVQTRILIG